MPRFQDPTASAVMEDMLIRASYIFRSLLLVLPLTLFFAGSLATAQADPLSVEELVTEANFYLSRRSCELAQLRFQQALEREPANQAAAIGKGDALVCQGAFDLGIQEYQNVISSDPNSVRAYNQLAIAYRDQYISDSQRYPNRLVGRARGRHDRRAFREQPRRCQHQGRDSLSGGRLRGRASRLSKRHRRRV